MVAEGADIIDIGAESTRPYGGARAVPVDEEIAPADRRAARRRRARRAGLDRHHEGRGRGLGARMPAPPSSTTSGACSAIPTWRGWSPTRRAGHRHAQPRRADPSIDIMADIAAFFARSLEIADARRHRARAASCSTPASASARRRSRASTCHRPASGARSRSACRCWSAPRASASSTRSRLPRPTSASAARSPPSLAAAGRRRDRAHPRRRRDRAGAARRRRHPERAMSDADLHHRACHPCLSRRDAARGQGRADASARSRARHRSRPKPRAPTSSPTPSATTRWWRSRARPSARGATGWSRPPPARSPTPCSSGFPQVAARPGHRPQAARADRRHLRRCRRHHRARSQRSSARRIKGLMAEALIALGGNVGDVRATLDRAVAHSVTTARCGCCARSSDYSTPPWGVEDQPPFVNVCIAVETALSPHALLDARTSRRARLRPRPRERAALGPAPARHRPDRL